MAEHPMCDTNAVAKIAAFQHNYQRSCRMDYVAPRVCSLGADSPLGHRVIRRNEQFEQVCTEETWRQR
jgi:hypothetical protein